MFRKGGKSQELVIWYISRRINEPFIHEHPYWKVRESFKIDDTRLSYLEGINRARDFFSWIRGHSTLKGIITTNYDLITEYSLGKKGFNYDVKGEILHGRGAYPVSSAKNPFILTGKIRVSKIHGSI